MKKSILILALAVSLLGTSCLGPNKTFNDLRDWNKGATESQWGNEAIFLGLSIIPVYSLCYLADIVVFNSIEFWKTDGASAKM